VTWVCAASTIFGYGALYSDVQVTLRSGQTKDLIQKAYPLGNFIAAGFAGSVQIGFRLLQSLSNFVALSPEESQIMAWEPTFVSSSWATTAKSIFDSSPSEERDLGSRILMVGASPVETCGLGAKIYITRFASPDFRPGIMSHARKICHIGSGAGVREYKQSLKQHFRHVGGIHQAEVGEEGGWARQIGFSLSRALSHHPREGISRHLHILIVRRGGISVETNDENIYPPGDVPRIEIRMPTVAQGYEQFRAMTASCGDDAAGAIC
jgi:hypothetical protein